MTERLTLLLPTAAVTRGLPGGSDGKESACNAGDQGSIPAWGRSPGEGNGTHSSILAWRTPWSEETGGLQSMGSQKVRHDLVTNTHTHTHTHTNTCICVTESLCYTPETKTTL